MHLSALVHPSTPHQALNQALNRRHSAQHPSRPDCPTTHHGRNMAESEDLITNKRKASAEDLAEDVAGKRTKFEDTIDDAPPSNDRDTEIMNGPDGALPIENEPHTQGSPTRTDRAERQTEPPRSPEARRPSASGGPPVRRNVSLEEKKRGQRLFGGLVNTLSRTTSGSQQQKRLEIDRRQHEKAQQRRAEVEKRRAERLQQLKKTRPIEQVKLDERVESLQQHIATPSPRHLTDCAQMKTRHSTMLAKAHSLQTRSEPKLVSR